MNTVTIGELAELLDEMIPLHLAESWDNVGLMLGRRNRPVKRILLALDMTQEVVAQAIAKKADMLLTHHPAIFRKLTNSDEDAMQLALDFYGPMYLLYSIYDGAEDKSHVIKLLEEHMDHFLQEMQIS